jgi:hypothetical protein
MLPELPNFATDCDGVPQVAAHHRAGRRSALPLQPALLGRLLRLILRLGLGFPHAAAAGGRRVARWRDGCSCAHRGPPPLLLLRRARLVADARDLVIIQHLGASDVVARITITITITISRTSVVVAAGSSEADETLLLQLQRRTGHSTGMVSAASASATATWTRRQRDPPRQRPPPKQRSFSGDAEEAVFLTEQVVVVVAAAVPKALPAPASASASAGVDGGGGGGGCERIERLCIRRKIR